MSVDVIPIPSRFGAYDVTIAPLDGEFFRAAISEAAALVCDRRVWDLYATRLGLPDTLPTVLLDAVEEKKTVATSVAICKSLLDAGFRRGHELLVMGGGIVQDVGTFTASMLFRGIDWTFAPTTLLAQADSCIGGKSSLNVEEWKNQLGNFYPPRRLIVAPEFIHTLEDVHVRSGVGEILKVHLLSGPDAVNILHSLKTSLGTSNDSWTRTIYSALKFKARIVAQDEFDTGLRLMMNFGHSFGHALEAATRFQIPHGIGVTLGCEIAGRLSFVEGFWTESDYFEASRLLQSNIRSSDWVAFDRERFYRALRHDKKNRAGEYCFILPVGRGKVRTNFVPMSDDTDASIDNQLKHLEAWCTKA